jgi:hypothetical protein
MILKKGNKTMRVWWMLIKNSIIVLVEEIGTANR